MTIQDSAFLLSAGKHTGGLYDLTSTPTLIHRLPERHSFYPPGRGRLQIAPFNPTNKRFPAKAGVIDVSKSYTLEQILTGLSGNNGGAIAALTANQEIADILDVAFGTASTDPAGAATTVVNAGSDGSLKTLAVTETARFPVGTVLMFQAPAGTYHVRQVRARSGASGAGTLTTDRTWTGSVANLTTAIRCARWVDDPSVHEHTHMYFRGEWQGGDAADPARIYLGGMCSLEMDFATAAQARLMTSWRFSDVQDVAPADTAFSTPTRGQSVVCANNSFWIGDNVYYATDLKMKRGGTESAFVANSGPNGVQGYKVMKGGDYPRTTMSVTLPLGPNTGEVNDALLNTLLGEDLSAGAAFVPLDIAAQAGGAAAAFAYNVMCAAVVVEADASRVIDGRRHVALTFEATDPVEAGVTGGSSLYPYEFHLG